LNRFGEPSVAGARVTRFIRFPGLTCLPVCVSGMALLVMLAACDQAGMPGQPVARVNGKSITTYQLGDELGRNVDARLAGNAEASVLQELVARELLQAEALKNRLDRDPHVAAALANARTYILAQAYLQSRVAYVSPPSREEVKAYFDKHPEKFSRRKIFHVKEIILPPDSVTDELKAAMDSAKTLEDMSAWLDGQEIAHSQSTRIQDSAELPDGLLAKMLGMQAGQLFVINSGASASLMTITDILESPLGLDAAAPRIERMMLAQRGQQLGETELERMRASAKVEYADSKGLRLAASPKGAIAVASENIVKVSGEKRDASQ
jgi:EpsD family peptidyl-prolyl cis-trans isomerase